MLPDGLRERGAEVDVVALYETVAEPLGEAGAAALGRATHVTFTSSSTVRFLVEALDGAGLGEARVVSIGPVTSETLREHGIEPDVEARPTRHRRARRGAGRATRRDRHAAHRLRARRRLRRRLPRRDPHDPPRGADHRHHPRRAQLRGAPGRARAAQHAAVHAGGGARGGRRPAGRHRAARGRAAHRGRAPAGGARQRPAEPGLGALRRDRPGRGRDAARRTGWSPSRRPSTAATSSRRWRPTWRAGRRSRTRATRSTPAELAIVELPEPRVEDGALVAHVLVVDRFGNAALDVGHEELAGTRHDARRDGRAGGGRRALPQPPTRRPSRTCGPAS